MSEFRKKPVVIQAWPIRDLLRAAQSDWAALPEQVRAAYEAGDVLFLPDAVNVLTREGTMSGKPDDWLIRGVQGELYPCKPDIFAATYEPVAE